MSYEKQTWATGDTITAEKLNNAENGIENAQWKTEGLTQLFSENVTTTAGQIGNMGTLAYSDAITVDTLTVVFDGTTYFCDKTDAGGGTNGYGGFGENGPDFSEYPFAIISTGASNMIVTETAGTYSISASVPATTYTQAFSDAILANVKGTYKVTINNDNGYTSDKTFAEILAAYNAGLYIYAAIVNSQEVSFAYLKEIASSSHIKFTQTDVSVSDVTESDYTVNINGTVTSETITYNQ